MTVRARRLAVKSLSSSVQSVKSGRKLELKARAERQAQTRQRIVEAAVALHTTVGPAQTTVSAIAERAGVQRQTVYAHFPSDRVLLEACSAHVRATSPPPDPARWADIADPERRLRAALAELYPYFRRTARSWSNILRDAEVMPVVREIAGKRRLAYLDAVADGLAAGWGARGARRERLRAAIALAVDFRTWQTLAAKSGLTDEQAVSLMTAVVACAADR